MVSWWRSLSKCISAWMEMVCAGESCVVSSSWPKCVICRFQFSTALLMHNKLEGGLKGKSRRCEYNVQRLHHYVRHALSVWSASWILLIEFFTSIRPLGYSYEYFLSVVWSGWLSILIHLYWMRPFGWNWTRNRIARGHIFTVLKLQQMTRADIAPLNDLVASSHVN